MDLDRLKKELDILWRQYHRPELLLTDPLGNVSGALSPEDFEIISFVSAGLSYGRVEQIKKSLDKLWKTFEVAGLGEGGSGIKEWLVDKNGKTFQKDTEKLLKGWVHRFNDAKDMAALFFCLKKLFEKHKSLADLYASIKKSSENNPTDYLENFSQNIRSFALPIDQSRVRWFSCAPSEGSTCKRLVMWLRWMLRSDEIDPGLWTQRKVSYSKNTTLNPSFAFIPLDTHVFRWAQARQLVTKKNPSWKAVEEVTSVLRELDPKDPARFDFCICHSGMNRFRNSKLKN